MKKGFTMIELIFVIVILGILAAVAIPRLAATRDDAKIATAITDVTTAIQDMGSYYTAQGKFGTASEMTNVDLNGTDGNATSGGSWTYKVNDVDCVDFNTSATDGNLTVGSDSAGTNDGLCKSVQDQVTSKDLNGTHVFGGHRVTF